jgi:hypothetical protein
MNNGDLTPEHLRCNRLIRMKESVPFRNDHVIHAIFADNPVDKPAVGIFLKDDTITRRDHITNFIPVIKGEWSDGDIIVPPDKRMHAQSNRLDPDRDLAIQNII